MGLPVTPRLSTLANSWCAMSVRWARASGVQLVARKRSVGFVEKAFENLVHQAAPIQGTDGNGLLRGVESTQP